MVDYVSAWKKRCYFHDIPDEVCKRLQNSGRVPSYKQISMCILKGDLNFYGLGFSRRESDLTMSIMEINNATRSP